ncbi:VOC family protein [Roseobacteraceae bacterium S113]
MSFQSAIPVLRVDDYPASRAFWAEAMGFDCVEEGGDPARFGIFRRDAATVFVDSWHGADPAPAPNWRAYFHVPDVDALAADLGALVLEGPNDTVYGMREIVVCDPAGNRLAFGQDI